MRLQIESSVRLIGRRLLEMALRSELLQKKQELAMSKLAEENSSRRHQLDDLALRAEEWAIRAQAAEANSRGNRSSAAAILMLERSVN